MQTLKFRLAEPKDSVVLTKMINRAYRAQTAKSWTNEALIISGDRISEVQLQRLIEQQHTHHLNSQLLIAELNDHAKSEIIGCIALSYNHQDVEIGTFCIAPEFQNSGYGQHVLKAAELYAMKHQPKLKSLSMWVLDVRSELIEYYERRGYLKTGSVDAYPLDADVGQPLVQLELIQLVKKIEQ